MTSVRRSLLKSYILTLAAEGHLAGARSLTDLGGRVVKLVLEDVAQSGGELLALVGAQQVRKMGDAVLGAMGRAVDRAIKSGRIGDVFREVRDIYDRGAAAKGRR